MNKDVTILGGGFSGMATAYFLAQRGYRPVVLEKADRPGGLGASWQIGEHLIDKAYHLFLDRDRYIVELLKELDLLDSIAWKKTDLDLYSRSHIKFMGYMDEGRIHYLSSGRDVLFSRYFTLAEKWQLIRICLKLRQVKDWEELDNITSRKWLLTHGSFSLYKKIFEPLLHAKWDHVKDEISAAWIWARIGARVDLQHMPTNGGRAGCLQNSSTVLFRRLNERILEMGGTIHNGIQVNGLRIEGNRVIGLDGQNVSQDIGEGFNALVSTLPQPILQNILPNDCAVKKDIKDIRYQAVICATFGLTRSLTNTVRLVCPPGTAVFAGIVEKTNIMSPECVGDQHVIYLFNYVQQQDELWQQSDEDIIDRYVTDLKKLFPDLADEHILWHRIFRNRFAEPIYEPGYIQKVPAVETGLSNFFIVNLTQVLPVSDFNYIIKNARHAAETIAARLDQKE